MNQTIPSLQRSPGTIAVLLLCSLWAASSNGQSNSIDAALELHDQALAAFAQRDYENGTALAEQAVRARESALGIEHPDTLASLSSLADFYRVRRDFERAEGTLRRVLAIAEKAFGPEHAQTANALIALGMFHQQRAEFAQAEPLYVRALALREKLLGPQHAETAATTHLLGTLYLTITEFAKAEPLLQRAVTIREQVLGEKHIDTTKSLNNLAIVYTRIDSFAKAGALHSKVAAIREAILGPEHPLTLDTLENLALLYSRTAAYSKSAALFGRVLEVRRRTLGEEHPETAYTLTNLGRHYIVTGLYEEAEPLLKRAVAIVERTGGSQSPEFPRLLANLADLYRYTGAYSKAEPLYQRALWLYEKIFGPDYFDIIAPLDGLADLYSSRHLFDRAEPLFLRAIELSKQGLGTPNSHTAVEVMHLSAMYAAAGAYTQAEQRYLEAVALFEQILGPEHQRVAESLSGLGTLYRLTGAYGKAEATQRRAQAIFEKAFGPRHPMAAATVRELGLLSWATGRIGQALPLLQRAQSIDSSNGERFLVAGTESRNRSYLDRVTRAVFQNVSISVAIPGRDSSVLGLTSVLQYKGLALDAAADSTGRLRKSVQSDDRALFEQLADVAAEFSRLIFQGAADGAAGEYRQRLQELSRRQEDLEAQLAVRSTKFRSEVMAASVANVARALPTGAALIEWFRYEPFAPQLTRSDPWGVPRYLAYVLKRQGSPIAIDIGPVAEVDQLVNDFRRAVSDPQRSDVQRLAAALSGKLLGPLRTQLAEVRHLMMAPDGALSLVPMAALQDPSGRYLVETFEITYLTSGRDLLRVQATDRTLSSNSVVMGGPTFGQRVAARTESTGAQQRAEDLDRSGLIFRSLPGTEQEVAAILTLLGTDNARLYTRDAATETRLKQLHGPRILHLATHGFFLNDQQARKTTLERSLADFAVENPLLRSGLALAGANERRSGATDDGILTALEASRLDLLGTELVVLSACETGVGEVRNGDGVNGLRRSLLLAGARSQVASLWKVADLPTKQLMVGFYQGVVKGKGRSAALRRAQLEMLASPALSHPYYWASFTAIGDWTPLPAD